VFFRFFDRAPVCEILGGRQRFGMRQSFDHFGHGGLVQTSRYGTGESLPIKAEHREIPPHLETMYAIQHISKEEYEIISGA
jgi:hypothetical protein